MNLSQRLRVIRVARGVGVEELEDRAGLARKTVSHFEAGRRHPNPATTYRLAMALDVPVSALRDSGYGEDDGGEAIRSALAHFLSTLGEPRHEEAQPANETGRLARQGA